MILANRNNMDRVVDALGGSTPVKGRSLWQDAMARFRAQQGGHIQRHYFGGNNHPVACWALSDLLGL